MEILSRQFWLIVSLGVLTFAVSYADDLAVQRGANAMPAFAEDPPDGRVQRRPARIATHQLCTVGSLARMASGRAVTAMAACFTAAQTDNDRPVCAALPQKSNLPDWATLQMAQVRLQI